MTRSLTPSPATLPLADVRRLDAVRERLCHGLRVTDTLSGLRAYVTELASELEDAAGEQRAPDTERVFGAPWEGDAAPSTPRASDLGEEYGV